MTMALLRPENMNLDTSPTRLHSEMRIQAAISRLRQDSDLKSYLRHSSVALYCSTGFSTIRGTQPVLLILLSLTKITQGLLPTLT